MPAAPEIVGDFRDVYIPFGSQGAFDLSLFAFFDHDRNQNLPGSEGDVNKAVRVIVDGPRLCKVLQAERL